MKNILILIGIAIINLNALAQPNLNAVIEFEESTIDYGTIEKGGRRIAESSSQRRPN